MTIIESARRYEAWLEKQLEGDFRKKDLEKKHKKMAKDAFQFLRATYWRWAEKIYDKDMCPELKGAPHVLAVGDIHVENFGTWRDGEGRLVWGVNDFDEAARMPYAIDIVRLATSAELAEVHGISHGDICNSILAGYRDGLEAPRPIVLDRHHKELRKRFVVTNVQRKDFWEKFDPDKIREKEPEDIKALTGAMWEARFRSTIEGARPDKSVSLEFFTRVAGTGSLGRPRIFGVGEWQGDLIVREAKAIVPSAWLYAHHSSHNSRKLHLEEIAHGRYRSPDLTYRLHGNLLVRRLSPNDFKIETKDEKERAAGNVNPRAVVRRKLVYAEVLKAMGHDLAAIHAATTGAGAQIIADLNGRKRSWLHDAAKNAARAVRKDFKKWGER